LVSGGGDGRINLWRIDPSQRGSISSIYTLEDGREEGESILSLAREGSFLYSGRFDGEVNVWDLETRQLVRSLKASTGDVHTLSLGAGVLYAGGKSGAVQVSLPDDLTACLLTSNRNSTNITRQSRRFKPMMDSSLPQHSRITTTSPPLSLAATITQSSSGNPGTARGQVP
jgi:WD40 repeat protein